MMPRQRYELEAEPKQPKLLPWWLTLLIVLVLFAVMLGTIVGLAMFFGELMASVNETGMPT